MANVLTRALAALAASTLAVSALALAGPSGTGSASTADTARATTAAAAEVTCVPNPASQSRVTADVCVHGPDDRSPLEAPPRPQARAATAGIECYGDGRSGPRVQAVYARASDQPDRFASAEAEIRAHAAQVEAEVAASAARTGGVRHVRFVTTPGPGCELDILRVTLGEAGDEDFSFDTVPQLANLGLDQVGRAYLVWMEPDSADPFATCGVGTFYQDDRPGHVNANAYGPSWSRVDRHCWGDAEAHELGHNLGGVQPSAPNSNGAGHCRDEWDLMCYSDGYGAPVYSPPYRCPDKAVDDRLWDCGGDDYFNTSPEPGSYLATHWNLADSPFLATTPSLGAEGLGAYHPVSPGRVYDGRWPGYGRLAPGPRSPDLAKVTGYHGIPSAGVAAVQLNVTVTEPLAAGFLSLYSADDAVRPGVSNLNFGAGQTVANSVLVTVPADGAIRLFASSGDPYVVIDVAGWYADGSGYQDERGGFHPVTPFRLHDTRVTGPALGPGGARALAVRGVGPVPATGVTGVVLNVTAVGASVPTFLTVHPADEPRPFASNINAPPGAAVPNQVVAKLSAAGAFTVFNAAGTVDVVVDVMGWFDDGSSSVAAGSVYHAIPPQRFYDSRLTGGALAPGEDRLVHLGLGGVAPNATAVVANLTVALPTVGGYVNAYPFGAARPLASLVNFEAGQTVPNLATIPLGSAHAVFHNPVGSTHLIVDVTGWYGPPPG